MRCRLFLFLSTALACLGREGEARDHLRKAHAEQPPPEFAVLLHCAEARIDAITLNLSALADSSERFLAHALEHNLTGMAHEAWWHGALARYAQNDLAGAELFMVAMENDVPPGQDEHRIMSRLLEAKIAFAQGRMGEARQIVKAGNARMVERSNPDAVVLFDALRAELSVSEGKLREAVQWLEGFPPEEPDLPLLCPHPWISYARVALAVGTPETRERAGKVLRDLFKILGDQRRPIDEAELRALRALWHQSEGRMEEALADAARAVDLAAPGGAVRILAEHGPGLAPLLRCLKLDRHEAEFVERVLAAMRTSGKGAKPAGEFSEVEVPGIPPLIDALTKREYQVLVQLAERYSNKHIAAELGISVETVKRHAANIYGKLDAHGREAAVAKAVELGILKT